MTAAAGNGHRCGPPGQLGFAWLLDTIAKLGDRPVAQIDYPADSGAVTYPGPDGRDVVPASRASGPPA